MKKYIFLSIALLSGVAFTSCNNEEDDIFDQSAAERLEASKAEYTEVFTANGGKWLMEYFANTGEQGYAYVVTFNADGSVNFAGNNKWLNGYKSEKSLWEIILDNGPVLTFNSYNSVFHIMSDPANIIGGPTSDIDGSDIDETGTGHAGDYEFMIMGATEESGDDIRLKGKKRGYNIWMRPLAADTDDKAFLAEYAAASSKMFNTKISPLYMTDDTGERFIVTTDGEGIFTFYPEAGDPVTQTVSYNAMMTPEGVRFMYPVAIPRANGDYLVVENFVLDESKQLVCEYDSHVATITAGAPANQFVRTGLSWSAQYKEELVGGEVAAIMQAVADEALNTRKKMKLTAFEFSYNTKEKMYMLTVTASNLSNAYYLGTTTANEDGTVSFSFPTGEDMNASKNGENFYNSVASMKTFMDYLSNTTFVLSSPSATNPSEIKFVSAANSSDYFTVSLK